MQHLLVCNEEALSLGSAEVRRLQAQQIFLERLRLDLISAPWCRSMLCTL